MRKALCLSWLLVGSSAFAAQSTFDADQNIWTLNNGAIQAAFQLTSTGNFITLYISSLQSGDVWGSSPGQLSSLIHLQAGSNTFDAHRQYRLTDHYTEATTPSGVRQYIVLQDLSGAAQITVILEAYDNQPVLRYTRRYRNLTGAPVFLTSVDMLPFTFADNGSRYTAFRVNQWSVLGLPSNFETAQSALDPDGAAVEVYSGAHGQQCGWLAVRDANLRGLFAGWEFDGRTKTTVLQQGSQGYLQFNSSILDLNHAVAPMDDFQTPWG